MSLSKQERHTLEKIIRATEIPYVSGGTFDENMKRTSEGDDPALLNDINFKAGFGKCYQRIKNLLEFFLSASKKDMIKFAGKADKKK